MSAATAEPSHKDAIVAILGASAALGGFVLAFFGLLISAYQSYGRDVPKAVRQVRQRAAWTAFAAFPFCIVTIAAALAWLVFSGGSALFWVAVGLFATELLAIVAVAATVAARLLR